MDDGLSPEKDLLSVALALGELRAAVSPACSELKVKVEVDGAVDDAVKTDVDPSVARFSLIDDVVVNR